MPRKGNPFRTGHGAMDLDSMGRRNTFTGSAALSAAAFNTPENKRILNNIRRRKSNGGNGG